MIKIIQDADIIDHMGVVDIWVEFHYQAHLDEPLSDAVRFYENDFRPLAARMRGQLNYGISRQIFDDRYRFVMDFVNRMKVEADGVIYNLGNLKKA